ncbi:ATP-binding protein [Pendulispora rubella]|uniref:histidine kinase n=1 Tax=Pendulispora rubella TaxID=2741070 RepID=A0ABZ2KV63_9BACT
MVPPSSTPTADIRHVSPSIGLAWLVRLRWGAVGLQTVLVLVARLALGLTFPLTVIVPLLVVTATSNAALALGLRRGARSSQRILTAVLVFDTLVLTLMLHATGGAANPFSVFYLVQVALAALLLDASGTWLVAMFTSIGFGTLFAGLVFPGVAPVQPHVHHAGMDMSGSSFSVHLQGMWAAYTLAALFVGYFVTRLARALERQRRDLLALQEVAAKAEKLASLSTLAAGAAHELGTPLATIAVVAKELERASERAGGDVKLDPKSIADDARLLRAEAERCRTILAQMGAHAGENQGEAPRAVSANRIAEDVLAALDEGRSKRVAVHVSDAALTVMAPPRALVQVLLNVVRNGLDASDDVPSPRRQVRLELSPSTAGGFVDFQVTDEGSGIPPELVVRLGEPFLTTKAPGRGLGLGLFLVRAFVERTGGRLDIASRVGEGTKVTLSVPAGEASA